MGKKGILLAIFILLVAVIGTVVWKYPRPQGPSYNGKNLSAWLKELPAKGNDSPGITWAPLAAHPSASELAAVDAVQHIGTNALPFLMDELRTKKLSPQEELADGWKHLSDYVRETYMHQPVRRQISGEPRKTTAQQRHWDAARGLHALGPLAQPVMPELIKLINNADTSPDAVYALSSMGPEGFDALSHTITSKAFPFDWMQMCAIWALGQNRTNAGAAALLVPILQDKDFGLRMAAAWSLGQIQSDPELVAPALASALGDTDANVRSMAERALKEYGITAITARSLTEYLNSPKLHVRMAATNALRVLHPKEAADAGIK